MFTVVNCIVNDHDLLMVFLAAIMCIAGSAVTLRLYQRILGTAGAQRFGWQFLTAVAAGSSIWATHFIAMLGYQPSAPISFDPMLTIISLLTAIAGTLVGLSVAGIRFGRIFPALGGGVIGLSIAAMHYTGMFAYRIEGFVDWSMPYIVASIFLSVVFSGLTFKIATTRAETLKERSIAVAAFVTAIVSLHFTGMAALTITPMTENFVTADQAAIQALALAIAGVALLILGTGLSSYLIDRTIRWDSHEQLRLMALHDQLTSLPNRANFNNHLSRQLARATENGEKVAVICVDLNRFKEINDTRGHSAGDETLRLIASRMQANLKYGEFVARFGGDEFAAVKYFTHDEELTEFCQRTNRIFFEPMQISGLETIVGASLGAAVYPDDADSPELLVANADLAMFHAKSNFMESVCHYNEEIGKTVRDRRGLADALQNAIQDNALTLHYQRQTSLIDGSVCGYEALLRWNHPVRGNVPPDEFIPIAEENGLIVSLGEWVLRQACHDAANRWQMSKVAVNVSAVQLIDPNLPQLIHQILLDTGLAPERLELELTETAVIKDKIRSLHCIRQIKALGVGIALDDFGSGYSSLETLRTFPFDKIKLDRTFIEGVQQDKQSRAIIRAVLALGKSLDIPVLAEGIETVDQMDLLQSEGCDEAQGYLLGRPGPLDDLTKPAQLELDEAAAAEKAADSQSFTDDALEELEKKSA